ncbi:hypothetical protein SODG_005757 [Sodalis praecaptivus]
MGIKGVGIFAGKIFVVARRILTVIQKPFTQSPDARECPLERLKIGQIGGFERLEQHHLMFKGAGNHLFRLG